jgi:hypothetical protein
MAATAADFPLRLYSQADIAWGRGTKVMIEALH